MNGDQLQPGPVRRLTSNRNFEAARPRAAHVSWSARDGRATAVAGVVEPASAPCSEKDPW